MAEVILEHVSKEYTDGTRAVDDLDLPVDDGELLVLVGPSGCGKTTVLRMVAGLEDVSSGTIRVGDRVINDVPPKDRDTAMVFQSYALYPHLSVADNIGFGLKLRKMPKDEITRRVKEVAGVLGLEEHLSRKPRHLSGGQRQRVAMGRAIVREPQAFLMDEPLSNLDAKLRVQMRAEIARIQRNLEVTTVYVTHDQNEAMTLGHRVAVMHRGVLQQVDAPQVLYDRPENLFVAGFIGSPAMNVVEATFEESGDGLEVHLGAHGLAVSAELLAERPALRSYMGRPVLVGIRPEDLEDAAMAEGPTLSAAVELVEAMGAEIIAHLSVDAPVADVGALADLGEEASLRATELVGRFSPRSRVREGQRAEVAVATDRLHVFDRETGLAIGGTSRKGEA